MAKKAEAEVIKKFLDDLWGQAQGMLSKGKITTEKAAHSAKSKLDIYMLGVKRKDLYLELGEAFYLSTKNKKPSAKKQQAVLDIIGEIKELDSHEKNLKKEFSAPSKAPGKKARRGRPPKKKAGRPKKAK